MTKEEIIEEIASIDEEYAFAVIADNIHAANLADPIVGFLETFRQRDYEDYRGINAKDENCAVLIARIHGGESRLDDIILWIRQNEGRKATLDKRKAELLDMLQAKPAKSGRRLTSTLTEKENGNT